MQCATGCSDCCHVQLTITAVEAAAIRAHVATWPRERRSDLANTEPGSDRCAALDSAGKCKVYDARPLVCRSHGVPIRMTRNRLPVVESCHRNFTRTAPDPDCILDQATLSATIHAIDALDAAEAARRGDAPGDPARAAGGRVELASLLADLAAI